jgi:hypothetical protein
MGVDILLLPRLVCGILVSYAVNFNIGIVSIPSTVHHSSTSTLFRTDTPE